MPGVLGVKGRQRKALDANPSLAADNPVASMADVGGADPATTAALGTVRMATAPTVAGDPIAVGDNDPRMANARPPTAHTHPQSDVTDLPADLAAKADAADGVHTGFTIIDDLLVNGGIASNGYSYFPNAAGRWYDPNGIWEVDSIVVESGIAYMAIDASDFNDPKQPSAEPAFWRRLGVFAESITRFWTPGTHTYDIPLTCHAIHAVVIGAGGGGGGAKGGSSQAAAGGGGASGAWVEGVIAVTPGTTLNVVVGTGGGGGSGASANPGSVGGQSLLERASDGVDLFRADGGNGGAGMDTGTSLLVQEGGLGPNPYANIAQDANGAGGASHGNPALRFSGSSAVPGAGGGTPWGAGGGPQAGEAAGRPAPKYPTYPAAGGGGGGANARSTSQNGGAGADGAVFIRPLGI